MSRIINEGLCTVAIAYKDWLARNGWMGWLNRNGWPQDQIPPQEDPDMSASSLTDCIGLKRIGTTTMVVEDVLGDIQFYGRNYRAVSDDEAFEYNYRTFYAKTILNWDQELPICDFHQTCIVFKPLLATGYDQWNSVLPYPLIRGLKKGPFVIDANTYKLVLQINDGPLLDIVLPEGTWNSLEIVDAINDQLRNHAENRIWAWQNDQLVYVQGEPDLRIGTYADPNGAYSIFGWHVPTSGSPDFVVRQLLGLGKLFWLSNDTRMIRHQNTVESFEIVFEIPLLKADGTPIVPNAPMNNIWR